MAESTIDDEQLLLQISKHPAIYDPKNESYKLHTKKEALWIEIAGYLNTSAAACKKRWKNIRDNYYKANKATKKSTGSAAPVVRRRNPILDQLQFLDVVEHERRLLTNTDTQLSENIETGSEDVLDDKTMDENIIAADTPTTTDTPYFCTNAKPIDEALSDPIKETTKKRKMNVTSKILTAIQKGTEERAALMSHITVEDEIDILFKSLAITVKKFPPLLRAETKKKIFQVISEAELQLLRPEPHSNFSPNYSSNCSYPSSNTTETPSTPNWNQQDTVVQQPENEQDTSDDEAHYLSTFQDI